MVNKLVSYILTVSSTLLFPSCQQLPQTPEELEQFISDPSNGLRQEKQLGDILLKLQYRPTDLLVAQELKGSTDKTLVDELRSRYASQAYFVLSLSQEGEDVLNDPKHRNHYSETLQNLAFRMDQFVQMTTSEQDTIPLSDFAFPRLYGYGGSTQVLLVFSQSEVKEADWLQVSLQDFGIRTGKQHFRFYRKDLDRVPTLNLASVVYY